MRYSDLDEKFITVREAFEQYDTPAREGILRAIRLGYIKAEKIGNTWVMDRQSFLDWLNDPSYHQPGLKRGQKIRRPSKK